jgi:hypothetical protein
MKLKKLDKEITEQELTEIISVICQMLYGTKESELKPLNELLPKFENDCRNIAIGIMRICRVVKK